MGSLKNYLNIYEFPVELPISGQKLIIKPLTTNGMKKLLIYENVVDPVETEIIIDSILETNILTEDIQVFDLFIQDRYFLFVELRKVSKGSTYNFEVTCPHCKGQSLQHFDLNSAEIKKFDPENFNNEIKLIKGTLTLKMKLCKRVEQYGGYKLIDPNLSTTEKKVEMILMDLALSIDTIIDKDGNPIEADLKERVEFIGGLPESEYDIVKNWLNENYYGYNLEMNIQCPHCKKTIHNQSVALDNFLS